jgi:hypothetical protein
MIFGRPQLGIHTIGFIFPDGAIEWLHGLVLVFYKTIIYQGKKQGGDVFPSSGDTKTSQFTINPKLFFVLLKQLKIFVGVLWIIDPFLCFFNR